MENDVILAIHNANKKKNRKTLNRRIMKLGEEYGELAQAFLSVTSKKNNKKKTWKDVREEAVDCIIVAIDVAMTQVPGDKKKEIYATVKSEIFRKLNKWDKQKKKKKEVV